MISHRATEWSKRDPFLVSAHFACVDDPFEATANPDGYVNFGTAENHLVFDAVRPLLADGQALREKDTHYNELHGAAFFREAIARFLSRRAGRTLSPDNIAVGSGASSLLETLSFVLCDPGDVILIPAPYYSGFDHDLALRSGAELACIPLEGPHFELSIGMIRDSYDAAAGRGGGVKALLLNSPQNPLGCIYREDLIRAAVDFTERNDLHLILDELYSESLMPGVSNFSGLSITSERIHVVYGFAKDFGLSGFKVGILHSESPEVAGAIQDCTYFHTVSMQTQRALAGLLTHPGLEEFLNTMRYRLRRSCVRATSLLTDSGIQYLRPDGGIVLWIDLRPFLQESSFEAELGLFHDMFNVCRVSIPPGQAFHCVEPGWFRLCFTVPPDHLEEGMARLSRYLATRNSRG